MMMLMIAVDGAVDCPRHGLYDLHLASTGPAMEECGRVAGCLSIHDMVMA